MKKNDFLPVYDFSEKHERLIDANPECVYENLKKIDFSQSRMIRFLFWLRGLKSASFKDFHDRFIILMDEPSREIALGLIACPWKLKGAVIQTSKGDFFDFNTPGYAKIVWNFTFEAIGEKTLVTTETKIFCTDKSSKRKFRIYWFFIKPFSGLVRIEMLRLLKLDCETHL